METKLSKKKIVRPQPNSVSHSKPGSQGNFAHIQIPADKAVVLDRIKSLNQKPEIAVTRPNEALTQLDKAEFGLLTGHFFQAAQ